jgi:hypothetical protein
MSTIVDERQLSFFREVETAYRQSVLSGNSVCDARFMHLMFCVAGLPLREPASRNFSRSTGTIGLNISAGTITLPDGDKLELGLPYGPKARLIVLSAISEARSPLRGDNDQWIEIGQIESWLREIGILQKSRSGQIMSATKDQLIRLCLSQFSTTYRLPGKRILLANDRIIDAGAFDEEELRIYARKSGSETERRKNMNQIRWPEAIRLSDKAFRMFRSDDAVPIPASRLSVVSHSAMAIDVFLFLSYTMPSIPPGGRHMVSWGDLISWFGNTSDAPSRFKELFIPALGLAMKAYPEAGICADDVTDEGLWLSHSDPAVLLRTFISVPHLPAPPAETVIRRKRRKVDKAEAA